MASVDVPVALLGYGTVGSAVNRLLHESADDIERATGHRLRVVKALVRDPAKERAYEPDPEVLTTDFASIIEDKSIALVAEVSARASEDQIGAFGTPSIVHFCVALLVSATLSAPWRSLASAAVVIGIVGLSGLLYAAIVIRRARQQEGYQPVFEDWLWHTILPALANAALVVASFMLERATERASFLIGGAALLLLFAGIHNAWDTATFVATGQHLDPSTRKRPER